MHANRQASVNAAAGGDAIKPTSSGPMDDAPPRKRSKADPQVSTPHNTLPLLVPLSFGAAEDKGHRTALEDVWVVHADARPPDTTVRHVASYPT